MTAVAGEATALPANPTPVAPSTGTASDAGGGTPPVFAVGLGLIVLSAVAGTATFWKRRRI